MSRRVGFSLIELMVVISIIAVLVGLLMVALGKVRQSASVTKTQNTLNQFAAACDQFEQVYGRYPGAVPEHVLSSFTSIPPPISSTENALLDLLGGYRLKRPGDAGTAAETEFIEYLDAGAVTIAFGGTGWSLAVNVSRIGEGPVIDGVAHGPFFTPGPGSLAVAKGQILVSINPIHLPDLIDAWGQPIVYMRRLRSRGMLISDDPADRPQFLIAGLSSYLKAGGGTGLGELNRDQIYNAGSNPGGSILTDTLPRDIMLGNYAYLLRHPGLGNPTDPADPIEINATSTARGAYVLISAGPDGVFFSATDGPGAPGDAKTDISAVSTDPTRVVQEYDDVLKFGGS